MGEPSQAFAKRTKAEILAAYQELRQQVEEQKKEQLPLPTREAQRREDAAILERTAQYTPASIEEDVLELKKRVISSLDEVQTALMKESAVLPDVRQAIEIERRGLAELRQIVLADNALQTLIAQYDEKRMELETEMTRKRREWEQEEEEYVYQLKLKRRKEEDEYELQRLKKRAAWQAEMEEKEKQLRQREELLAAQEDELAKLREQTDRFPVERDEAIKRAVEQRVTELNKEFGHERQLLTQEATATKQMLEAKIETARQTVEHQMTEIHSLKQALAEATHQAQILATTVVENVSGAKHMKEALQASVEKAKLPQFHQGNR